MWLIKINKSRTVEILLQEWKKYLRVLIHEDKKAPKILG